MKEIKRRPRKRFLCPECNKMKMTVKQKAGTNACGDCEISEFKSDKPKRIICWNKRCRREFDGTVGNSDKYTMCPRCKAMARDVEYRFQLGG